MKGPPYFPLRLPMRHASAASRPLIKKKTEQMKKSLFLQCLVPIPGPLIKFLAFAQFICIREICLYPIAGHPDPGRLLGGLDKIMLLLDDDLWPLNRRVYFNEKCRALIELHSPRARILLRIQFRTMSPPTIW